MFYPGQLVYVGPTKEVGVYIGEKKTTYQHGVNNMYSSYMGSYTRHHVIVVENNIALSKSYLFNELHLLSQPNPKAITGKSVYYGPKNKAGKYLYRKQLFNSVILDDEVTALTPGFVKAIKHTKAQAWFKEKYNKNDN